MSFWSSDLAEPGADDLAAWLRNVEGSPFGAYTEGDGEDLYYEGTDAPTTFDPTSIGAGEAALDSAELTEGEGAIEVARFGRRRGPGGILPGPAARQRS